MLKRIITAVVLIGVVFGVIFGLRIIDPIFVAALVLAASLLATYEMCQALKKSGLKPMMSVLMITSLLTSILAYVTKYVKDIEGNPLSGYLGILAAIVIMAIVACSVFTFKHEYSLNDLFATIFIMIYPIAILNIFVVMNNEAYGLFAILMSIIVPVMTDTMAYFTGVTIGGKKLCPDISPKKTIAGAIGGIVGAVIGVILVCELFGIKVFTDAMNTEAVNVRFGTIGRWITYIVFGLICGPVCEIGDLAASWIKRQAGIKDFGKIFPGHGGVMDRIDSIMFMIPMTLIFTELFIEVTKIIEEVL